MKTKMIILTLSLIKLAFSSEVVVKDYEKKIKSYYSVKSIVEKVPRAEIENSLRDFVMKSRPSRVMGSTGHTNAQKYIEEKLKELKSNGTTLAAQDFVPDVMSAGKMYEEDFKKEIVAKLASNDPNYIRWKNFTVSMLNGLNEIKNVKGVNYIWEKKGTVSPNEVIIVGANYDTLNHDPKTMLVDLKGTMPGADNNGSGTAMLLTMAKLLNQIDMPKTVRLVFFDAEEFGFLGSKAYVEMLKTNKDEKILGFINLVMLGNDTKIKDTEKKMGNMKVYLRDPSTNKEDAEKDLSLVNFLTNAGKAMTAGVTFAPTANGMNSSSHIRFWEAGIPAVCYTQNWETDFNPRFHTSDDFVETINMNTYVNSYQYLTGALIALNFGVVK